MKEKRPIGKLYDWEIRNIRIFRSRVKDLKFSRSEGRCEECGDYYGRQSIALVGRHKVPFYEYIGDDYNEQDNIIILCPKCNHKRVYFSNQFK